MAASTGAFRLPGASDPVSPAEAITLASVHQMGAASTGRAKGNAGDRGYVPDLVRGFQEHEEWRVKGMCAWSLGKLGGGDAVAALRRFSSASTGRVREEIEHALRMAGE